MVMLGVYTIIQTVAPITIFVLSLVPTLASLVLQDLKWATADVTVQVLTVVGLDLPRLLERFLVTPLQKHGVHAVAM
jgi:uncharacterized protein YqfA (UPF0365 family)